MIAAVGIVQDRNVVLSSGSIVKDIKRVDNLLLFLALVLLRTRLDQELISFRIW